MRNSTVGLVLAACARAALAVAAAFMRIGGECRLRLRGAVFGKPDRFHQDATGQVPFIGAWQQTRRAVLDGQWRPLRYGVVALIALAVYHCEVQPARASVIYSANFADLPYLNDTLQGQDGWSAFGDSGYVASFGGNPDFLGGTYGAWIGAYAVGSVQTGMYHNDSYDTTANQDQIVNFQTQVYLTGGHVNWQFAGMTSNLGAFIGGFNVLTDGDLQLITSGFPTVAAPFPLYNNTNVVYDLAFNFTTQTFNVLINGQPVASGEPFDSAQTVFGTGLVDTFGGEPQGVNSDDGYVTSWTITAVPEPATMHLLGAGLVTVAAGWSRRRRWPRCRGTADVDAQA